MRLTVEVLQTFYDELTKEADSENVVIAFPTKVWTEVCGYPMQDYSRARQALLRMEAVYIEQQGARGVASTWHLLYRPTEDAFTERLKAENVKEFVAGQLDGIYELLQGVNLAKELVAINERFKRIENRLDSAGIPDPHKPSTDYQGENSG